MGRDFEVTSYFPHMPLTARLVRRLFGDLAAAGLRVEAGADDDYPVLYGLNPHGGGVSVATDDVENLLRARTGALPAGYGVIPLMGRVPGLRVKAFGTLQFSVHAPAHPELDGVHLRIDDAVLRPDAIVDEPCGPGWQALLTWYGILCEHLHVAYGFGDWEDLFLQTAIPPSRRDVLAGQVDRLYRLNCFGPALVQRRGAPRVLATPADAVVRLRYGGVLIGGKLRYAGGDGEAFALAARHLGLAT